MKEFILFIVLVLHFSVNSTLSESPNGTNSHTPFPIEPVSDCQLLTTCETCSKSWTCVWCSGEYNNSKPLPDRCIEGTLLGPKTQCTNWQYRQCIWNGYWTMIATFVIAGIIVFLTFFIICCARFLCKKPKRYTNIQEMQPFLEPSREYHNDEYHETINIEEIRENERSLAEKRAQIYKEYEESAKLDTNPFSS